MEKLKVVKVKSWDELPEILEPGVYNVNGETITVEEDVSKEVVIQALEYKRKGKKGKTLL